MGHPGVRSCGCKRTQRGALISPQTPASASIRSAEELEFAYLVNRHSPDGRPMSEMSVREG